MVHTSRFGEHAALQSQENIPGISSDNIDIAPSSDKCAEELHRPINPFSNPLNDFLSFPMSQQQDIVGSPSLPPTAFKLTPSGTIPCLQRGPPISRPLIETSPRPTSLPTASLRLATTCDGGDRERWWHWLCGCSEDPDREGVVHQLSAHITDELLVTLKNLSVSSLQINRQVARTLLNSNSCAIHSQSL